MPTEPVPPDPGRDEDPARAAGEPGAAGPAGPAPGEWRELPPSRQDWLTRDEWIAWLDSTEPDEWDDPGEDPADAPAPPPDPAHPRAAGKAAKGARVVKGKIGRAHV